MLCRYMTSALVAGTEKMNIVRMVLVVKRHIALVWDLKQHSCNMARDDKIKIQWFGIHLFSLSIFKFCIFLPSIQRLESYNPLPLLCIQEYMQWEFHYVYRFHKSWLSNWWQPIEWTRNNRARHQLLCLEVIKLAGTLI